jgi:hypothetical protein
LFEPIVKGMDSAFSLSFALITVSEALFGFVHLKSMLSVLGLQDFLLLNALGQEIFGICQGVFQLFDLNMSYVPKSSGLSGVIRLLTWPGVLGKIEVSS